MLRSLLSHSMQRPNRNKRLRSLSRLSRRQNVCLFLARKCWPCRTLWSVQTILNANASVRLAAAKPSSHSTTKVPLTQIILFHLRAWRASARSVAISLAPFAFIGEQLRLFAFQIDRSSYHARNHSNRCESSGPRPMSTAEQSPDKENAIVHSHY